MAAVATWVGSVGGNIVHAEQHTDVSDAMFFQRVEFTHAGTTPIDTLAAGFAPVASHWNMSFTLDALPWKPRTAILCSKQLHCAADLLARTTYGDLGLDIAAVISNHDDAQSLATSFSLPFHHVAVGDGATNAGGITNMYRARITRSRLSDCSNSPSCASCSARAVALSPTATW